MKTTSTNKQIIDLINRAFDSEGYLINPKSRKNQMEAKRILHGDSYDADVEGYDLVNGHEVHNSLLVIAYPNTSL